MKKMILGAAASLMITLAIAQAKTDRPMMRQGRPGMEMKQLNLNDEQKAKLKSINQDFREQMQALNKKEDITVKQQREQRSALMQDHKTRMETVFTAEQKSELSKLRAERQTRRKEMGEQRFDRMKSTLNLSDDQANKLKSARAQVKAKTESLMKNESLDQSAKRQQLADVRKEMKSTLDNVLTPEQKEKWQTLRKEHVSKMRNHNRGARKAPMIL